jgi:choline dehydrogenase-like flavoprotein
VTSPTPQTTDFTRDVLGRYICNGLDEALASANQSIRADARPFDMIVIGGGSFGSAFAQHVFSRDQRHSHRVLVLEAGPFIAPEHVQNLPLIGLAVPGPTSIKDLRDAGQDGKARAEVWGLPWHSNITFTGLAYTLGGRSLYWGGWAPQLLDAEMAAWPAAVVADLDNLYFRDAAEQTGVTQTNDFIRGKMHESLRKRLFDGINAAQITEAIPLAELSLHLDGIPANKKEISKLEAPLAVQASEPRSGFFPFNKFSDLPLLIRAARTSYAESNGDDVKRRLMVVPNCHVTRLGTAGNRVVSVETNQGTIAVPPSGIVVLANGTIESARLALSSLPNPDGTIGRNLMVHLRSNLTIRIPRASFPELAGLDLEESALFVKGRHTRADGSVGYFHLQITAAGLGALGTDSEAELFKKIPDIDLIHTFKAADEKTIVVTIRGIGETERLNPKTHVTLDPEPDEYGMQRAFVSVSDPRAADGNPNDRELWDAMDAAALQVATVFAGGGPYETLGNQRDGLGTTHHETGTLWMGTDPTQSVTNTDTRFHHVENAYALGPALHPTIGSPNPMLTGVALARRLSDHLVPPAAAPAVEPGFSALFDGFRMDGWRIAGSGGFLIVDGALEAEPAGDLGLLWNTTPLPADFVLRLEWLRHRNDDNSGVFVRFPDPNSKGYNNTAWVGVNFGFEIQIDETAAPDGAPWHRTGAIYNEQNQQFSLQPARPVGQWNSYEIQVQGQSYTVFLNGIQVTHFQNSDPSRGQPTTPAAPSYFGLQAHTGRVAYRNIRIHTLAPGETPPTPAAAAAAATASP